MMQNKHFVFPIISCIMVYVACSTMFTVTTFDTDKTHVMNSYSFSYSRTIAETNKFIDDWLPSILILFSIWMLLCFNRCAAPGSVESNPCWMQSLDVKLSCGQNDPYACGYQCGAICHTTFVYGDVRFDLKSRSIIST